MTLTSPIIGLIERRGERVWFRNVSRYTDYTSGEPQEAYADNKSTVIRLVETKVTEDGRSIFLEKGRAVVYANPVDYWNNSMQVKVNDQVIRLPDNYSSGTSVIYRVDDVKRVALINQSQYYIRLDVTETKSKE